MFCFDIFMKCNYGLASQDSRSETGFEFKAPRLSKLLAHFLRLPVLLGLAVQLPSQKCDISTTQFLKLGMEEYFLL